MSLFSTIFHFSTSHLTPHDSTYRITRDTYNSNLEYIKPSLVPERPYNILDDGLFNKLIDNNHDFLKTPIDVTLGVNYNTFAYKTINSLSLNNTIRTLDLNGNNYNYQQLIANYKPQQNLLLDLFKPDGTNSNPNENQIILADNSFTLSKTYQGHGGIDTFIIDKPDTFFEISSRIYDDTSGAFPHQVTTLTFPNQDSTSSLNNPKLSYTLNDIERVKFSNKNLAFDLKDNAGLVAKVYGAVLGAKSITDAELVGNGLKSVDSGLNAENFAALAIKSTGLVDHNAIVNALWDNVFGSMPTPEQAQPYVNMLDSGQRSLGGLVMIAADSHLNAINIDLVGLTSHGIAFV